jgi:hypothetical protein
VCAQFLHAIFSHYIPGFDGKVAVSREANRIWPVSIPEKTDVFIANEIIDQLRNLLHRKLLQEKGRIQEFYNQMKYDKRRKSHGELSSSGEEPDEGDKGDEDITNAMFKELAEAKLRAQHRAKLREKARKERQAEMGSESSKRR